MNKPDRRAKIADAGIRVVARQGLRTLTHRAIDADLQIPAGSTSYYARTRHDLITLIAHRLAERTLGDFAVGALPDELDVVTAGATLSVLLDAMALRPEDHLARFALLLELRLDDEIHRLLSDASPVRVSLVQGATAILQRLGVTQPARHAVGLIVVMDGLLFDRIAGSGRADPAATIRAYLTGVM